MFEEREIYINLERELVLVVVILGRFEREGLACPFCDPKKSNAFATLSPSLGQEGFLCLRQKGLERERERRERICPSFPSLPPSLIKTALYSLQNSILCSVPRTRFLTRLNNLQTQSLSFSPLLYETAFSPTISLLFSSFSSGLDS